MNIELKAKYRTSRSVMGYPAKARTGNSHGTQKVRHKTGKANVGKSKVMLVDGLTGHRKMVAL